MAKSTCSGHCQACGRLQKLSGRKKDSAFGPCPTLAKHGYTITHGFFSGTCVGSGELPFEVSFDLLPKFIASASAERERIQTYQEKLRQPATDFMAWVRNYERLDSRGRCGYVWRNVQINGEVKTVTGRTLSSETEATERWIEYFYMAPGYRTNNFGEIERHRIDTVPRQINFHRAEDRSQELATYYNGLYADWKQHEVTSLERYIDWQRGRIRDWKCAPLLAHDHKDKEGFKPMEAPY